jgi:hypothetical protein
VTRALTPSAGPLVPRIINALLLRREFYGAVAADPHATGPAAGVVCLVALAREAVSLTSIAQVHPAWGLAVLSVVVIALVGWLLYGAFAYAVAWLLAPGPVELRRVLRCLGFAETVTVLRLIAFLVDPSFYPALHVALLAWAFAAVFVALRAATPAPTARLLLIAIPTFVAQQLVLAVGRALAY